MHWVLGKRREQHRSPVEAARATAKATRYAAAVGLIGTLATVGFGLAAEVVDEDTGGVSICTAVAIFDYEALFKSGTITSEEYEQLRADAIADQINDTADC